MLTTQALIIFAKLPRAGHVKTRLGKAIGMSAAAEIYKLFAEHAFTLGRQLLKKEIKVYVFYDPPASVDEVRTWVGPLFRLIPQEGTTLGDRMRRAFEYTFATGSSRTIIIGTDVPELDLLTLESAFVRLGKDDVVVGPSSDGGYYLLGMNAPTKELFDGVHWSSESVFHETIERLHRLNLSFAELAELADIDTISDYRAYQDRTRDVKHRRDP
ncbi:MAG: TIGR04282 family arsenosugar biosynthesis glycosyltransferase [Bacteroidota bacterium]